MTQRVEAIESAPTLVEHFYSVKIDYSIEFMKLYIVYNRWYRFVTGEMNDRIAIEKLKKRYVIWFDYSQRKTLFALYPVMTQLAEVTQRDNDWQENYYWTGYIKTNNDWRSLIEFWYSVRCKVVHGSYVKSEYTQLAYTSLYIFLEEIIRRMKCKPSNGYFDDWGVDMQPVSTLNLINNNVFTQ